MGDLIWVNYVLGYCVRHELIFEEVIARLRETKEYKTAYKLFGNRADYNLVDSVLDDGIKNLTTNGH